MLKGGMTVNVSGPADLYFERNDTSVDLLVDSVSIQPISQEEWKSHHDQSIDKVRKSKVKFQAIDPQGQPLANATIFMNQKLSAFPIGNGMSPRILNNPAYRDWHNSRFKWTVFENELKWHINEATPGNEDYSLADAMHKFAKKNDMVVRGHTIIWEYGKNRIFKKRAPIAEQGVAIAQLQSKNDETAPEKTKGVAEPRREEARMVESNGSGAGSSTEVLRMLETLAKRVDSTEKRVETYNSRVDQIPGAPPILKGPDSKRYIQRPFPPSAAPKLIPKRFKMPDIQKYDGTTDPQEHVTSYTCAIKGNDVEEDEIESVLLKKFGETLSKGALTWKSSARYG
ncbi:uncharacterized protein LOC132045642 [Lycium ferocissimum]|uniref:uncharacterized protein LOC132045642 n=1 Tax=Lycium ferocissimum TaxID=112874 RepID=UPI0028167CC6|nr:uncharacterized protein LOC132045642 [Lycium ferocissimum]